MVESKGKLLHLDLAVTIVAVCLHVVINICMESGVWSLNTMSNHCRIVSAETTGRNAGKDR